MSCGRNDSSHLTRAQRKPEPAFFPCLLFLLISEFIIPLLFKASASPQLRREEKKTTPGSGGEEEGEEGTRQGGSWEEFRVRFGVVPLFITLKCPLSLKNPGERKEKRNREGKGKRKGCV